MTAILVLLGIQSQYATLGTGGWDGIHAPGPRSLASLLKYNRRKQEHLISRSGMLREQMNLDALLFVLRPAK